MVAVGFDTLKFVHRLKEAGIPEQQAEAFTYAFQEAGADAEIATKRDIEQLDARLDAKMERFEARMERLDAKIDRVDAKIDTKIEEVRRDLREMELRLIIKLGAMLAVAIGVVAALNKVL
jgi:uncharacterized membrane protein YheB (UPF0754 family)